MLAACRDVPEADSGRRSATPLVWVEDDKLGHTMQSVALADGVGLAVRGNVALQPPQSLEQLICSGTLASLDGEPLDAVVAPWPDLVIATGRRTAPWLAGSRQSRGALDWYSSAARARIAPTTSISRLRARTSRCHRIRAGSRRASRLTAIDDRSLQVARERWR
jgi:hypothetical protein